MSKHFLKSFRSFGRNINVKVDFSGYAAKADLKNVKTEVDKLDFDKLAPVPVDLSKLDDVVNNDVFKKTVYDKLVAKVNNIDTSGFVLKTKHIADKTELGKKIPDMSNLVKKAKLTELENEIPDVSSLATKTTLTAVENKIPDVSCAVKKTDYNTKITEKLLKKKTY